MIGSVVPAAQRAVACYSTTAEFNCRLTAGHRPLHDAEGFERGNPMAKRAIGVDRNLVAWLVREEAAVVAREPLKLRTEAKA